MRPLIYEILGVGLLLASVFFFYQCVEFLADKDYIAGFLTLQSNQAGEICRRLKERGVFTDFRGERLRLGPAPYLSDRQLRDALAILGEVLGSITTLE